MGSVWVGHHLALDVDVAVKFIKADAFRGKRIRLTGYVNLAARVCP